MGVAASIIVNVARRAFDQIRLPGVNVQPGYSTAWMRASPGAHLLALVYNEFYRLYSDERQAEFAMRHSLALYWHSTSSFVWWPHNTIRAWRGNEPTKLLQITGHSVLRTEAPTVAVAQRCVSTRIKC